MGVCTEERPVMHWQQSARFLGPGAREKSPTPPVAHQGSSHCGSAAGVTAAINQRLLNAAYRACSTSSSSTCPDICDHSTKPFIGTPYSESFRSYETAERATFDETTIKYALSRSRTECAEISDETTSGISFKTEPYGPPSSPDSNCENNISATAVTTNAAVIANLPRSPDDCAGCGRLIKDRFYLSAAEKRWHINCLQCFACRQPLDRESSCFSRDGNIYCKSDYYSFFGTRRCSRCLASIGAAELVMRARNLVFHVNCFCCVVCHTPLTKGDQFGIIDALIYCRTHYSIAREGDAASARLIGSAGGGGNGGVGGAGATGIVGGCGAGNGAVGGASSGGGIGNGTTSVSGGSNASGGGGGGAGGGGGGGGVAVTGASSVGVVISGGATTAGSIGGVGVGYPYPAQFGSPPNDSSSPHSDPNRIVPTGVYVPAAHVIAGLQPQPPRQKGRPRKRKPKDIEALTANMDLNTEYMDFGRGSHMGGSSRTKRMRTSFKHHQLRTMKSYFAINHNPDAKDLKQLSQKTGLPKRVLQVWFQNARAKWRRMMMKQDGSGMLEKGDGSLDLDSISAHSPTSFMLGGGGASPPTHNMD